MNEGEEIQATLAEHRAWTWNRFKEQNGAHVIGIHEATGVTHALRFLENTTLTNVCQSTFGPDDCFRIALACWPTCKACASHIYNHCRTSFSEEVSVQSQVSGASGQLVLPNSENWGL
jgi:hypothetical protein